MDVIELVPAHAMHAEQHFSRSDLLHVGGKHCRLKRASWASIFRKAEATLLPVIGVVMQPPCDRVSVALVPIVAIYAHAMQYKMLKVRCIECLVQHRALPTVDATCRQPRGFFCVSGASKMIMLPLHLNLSFIINGRQMHTSEGEMGDEFEDDTDKLAPLPASSLIGLSLLGPS